MRSAYTEFGMFNKNSRKFVLTIKNGEINVFKNDEEK